ncbi:hypothetical protein FRC00_001769 [Tulasnella sp. 408]|nr:hypothetical protein FRC00_001769 [Tulasnella sp. 408]
MNDLGGDFLSIDAHDAHETQLLHDAYPELSWPEYPALNIVTACLTSFIVGTSLIIDRLRPGAITSFVMVELVWVGLLWPLWLSAAVYNVIRDVWWGPLKAVRVFTIANWLTLFVWWDILLTSSIRAALKGVSGVWRTPVREHLESNLPPHGQPPTTTVLVFNYGGPAAGHLQPGYGMPPAPQQPYWPQQVYGFPPPQVPSGIPQPQHGYGTPAPQQGHGTSQPQPIDGVPAPVSPPNASQG